MDKNMVGVEVDKIFKLNVRIDLSRAEHSHAGSADWFCLAANHEEALKKIEELFRERFPDADISVSVDEDFPVDVELP